MNARDWEIEMAKAEGADSEEIAELEDRGKLTSESATAGLNDGAAYNAWGDYAGSKKQDAQRECLAGCGETVTDSDSSYCAGCRAKIAAQCEARAKKNA